MSVAGTIAPACSLAFSPAVTVQRTIAVKIRAALFSCMCSPNLMTYSVLINTTSL
jgi:hypothetical protein